MWIVFTSPSEPGDPGRKAGLRVGEIAVPYDELAGVGAEIVRASRKGGPLPIYPCR